VRLALSNLIQILDKYQPKVIGLDLVLDSNFIGLGTSELLNTLVKTPRMVIAKSPQIGTLKPVISPSSAYGIVSFPDNQSTVRRYSSQENTFGVLVAQMLKKDSLAAFDESTFFINYQTMADGIYTVHSPEFDFVSLDSTFRPSSFLMLEGKDILNNDSLTLRALALLGNGRAFILGHLGNTNLYNVQYDGEDKHRVPPERQLVNREKSMFGILIHANAIENILNPELRYSCWSDSLIYQIIRAMIILIYIYYLLYYKLIKIINIFFSIFLISFPVIYLVLYLMTFQIYIDLGFVLIQIILLEDAVEVYQSLRDFILKKLGYEKTHF
ncbi:MAG: CHASE2 domain-containing protein, partial [Bacteroidota bacterium]